MSAHRRPTWKEIKARRQATQAMVERRMDNIVRADKARRLCEAGKPWRSRASADPVFQRASNHIAEQPPRDFMEMDTSVPDRVPQSGGGR
jgi:hypothetical protein